LLQSAAESSLSRVAAVEGNDDNRGLAERQSASGQGVGPM